MGSSYSNLTLRSSDRAPVVDALTAMRRDAFIVGPVAGWVAVLDDEMEAGDPDEQAALCLELTQRLGVPGLGACDQDDELLLYWLVDSGRLVDTFSWQAADGPADSDPKALLRHAEHLCRTLRSRTNAAVVAEILGSRDRPAIELHDSIVKALGLPLATAGMGYVHADTGRLEESFPELPFDRVPPVPATLRPKPGIAPRARPRGVPKAAPPATKPYRNEFLTAAIRRLMPMLQLDAPARARFERALAEAEGPLELRASLLDLQDAVRTSDERAAVRRLLGMLGEDA